MKRERRKAKAIRHSGFVELWTAILALKKRLIEYSGIDFHADTDLNAETVRLTKKAIKTLRAHYYQQDCLADRILREAKLRTDLEEFFPIRPIEKDDGWEIDLDLSFVDWLIEELRKCAKLDSIVLPRPTIDRKLQQRELEMLRQDKRDLESALPFYDKAYLPGLKHAIDDLRKAIKKLGGQLRADKQRKKGALKNPKEKKHPKTRAEID